MEQNPEGRRTICPELPKMPKKHAGSPQRTLSKNPMTTKDLNVGSNGPHHKATSSQKSRPNPSNSGLVLGNGALYSKHRKTDCRIGLGRLLARRMKITRITIGDNHRPRNGVHK